MCSSPSPFYVPSTLFGVAPYTAGATHRPSARPALVRRMSCSLLRRDACRRHRRCRPPWNDYTSECHADCIPSSFHARLALLPFAAVHIGPTSLRIELSAQGWALSAQARAQHLDSAKSDAEVGSLGRGWYSSDGPIVTALHIVNALSYHLFTTRFYH